MVHEKNQQMSTQYHNVTIPSGSVLQSGATGASPSYTITNNGTNWAWANVTTNNSLSGNTLKVNGDADISGELTVQGVNLSERLDRIEERLAILRPNEEMETKWDKLRGLRQAYMELEAEIKEKEEIWKILKK
jgi:hypothetical protein